MKTKANTETETGAKGKRYNPKGTRLSRSKASAGRANAETRVIPQGQGRSVLGGSLAEFGRACDRMLAEHVPGYRVRNFMGADMTEQVLAKAPEKRGPKDARPVQRIFWKSKPQERAVWS